MVKWPMRNYSIRTHAPVVMQSRTDAAPAVVVVVVIVVIVLENDVVVEKAKQE
jgi:hypothetical protein